ncbi:hypothetical protein [Nocardiopsis eucommiae]|uniref:hypothetical protein n=1 Tax=Nocardiopsis eucommiae TaxID=2831970 RepID=UPI003D75AFE9
MAYTFEEIEVSLLLLDPANARIGDEKSSQRDTIETLIGKVGGQFVPMTLDIATHGLDPTTLVAVVKVSPEDDHYTVLEGNRRTLSVKALRDPTIVKGLIPNAHYKRIVDASKDFSIDSILCVVFDSVEEAVKWVELRHTGANKGVGLVSWDANEQDRYKSRYGTSKNRKPAGQIIDFVDRLRPSSEYQNNKIITTLQRMVSTKKLRDALGVEAKRGRVFSLYPAEDVLPVLSYVVDELRSGRVKVTDVYYEDERKDYARSIPESVRPNESRALKNPIPLDFLEVGMDEDTPPPSGGVDPSPPDDRNSGGSESQNPKEPTENNPAVVDEKENGGPEDREGGSGDSQKPPPRERIPKPRSSVIERSCILKIEDKRIKAIYFELKRLNVEDYTNACAVLLRVFFELSVDDYLVKVLLATEGERRNESLAKKLKLVVDKMEQSGKIDAQLAKAMRKVADERGLLGVSTVTFNQYVHNNYVVPKPSEILLTWDELQPFMQCLWNR